LRLSQGDRLARSTAYGILMGRIWQFETPTDLFTSPLSINFQLSTFNHPPQSYPYVEEEELMCLMDEGWS